MGISNSSGLTLINNGLPPGGTTGQILTKISNNNFDANWQNSGAAGVTGITADSGGTTTGAVVTMAGGTGIDTVRSGDTITANIDATVATLTGTQTLTNKRVTKRTGTAASSATPTINTDNVDYYSLTAQAVDITSMTTNISGTPTVGQTLIIEIIGTGTHDITWGSGFEDSAIVTLPTVGAITTTRTILGFVRCQANTKWTIVAIS